MKEENEPHSGLSRPDCWVPVSAKPWPFEAVFLFRPLIRVNPEVRASSLIRVPLIKSILGLNICYSYVSHSLYLSPEPDFAPSLIDSSLCSAASSSIMRTSQSNWRRCGRSIGHGTLPLNRRCSDFGRNLGT